MLLPTAPGAGSRWGAAAGRRGPACLPLPVSRRRLCRPRCPRSSVTPLWPLLQPRPLPRAPALRPAVVPLPRPAGPAQPRPSRSRAGHAWPLPCPVPLVGERREGVAPPATHGCRRAWPPLQGKGPRPRRHSRPRPAQCPPPLCPAAPARCRISRGPAAPSDAPATKEARGKRITEGRREGTRTAGWFHQTLRAFLQNGQVLEDLHRPSLDPTAEKIAVDVAHPAIEFGPLAGSAFIY